MKKFNRSFGVGLITVLAAMFFAVAPAQAYVPVKISIKFILDAAGNRPGSGNLNTDAELDDQLLRGEEVLRTYFSELRLDDIEIIDLAGVSGYFSSAVNAATRDALRADALNNKALYAWRDNAVNIYINGSAGSGIADFAPDNNIILIGQNCRLTTVIHEMGHILELPHTHETCCGIPNQDYCADTLADNSGWTQDDIANNNYGDIYANLTPAQQSSVDMTWFNIMSYHPSRDRLSRCQLDRESSRGDQDQSWMLGKRPIYVNRDYGGAVEQGSWAAPYKTAQKAFDSKFLSNSVIVLMQGGYSLSTPVSPNDLGVNMVTRFSASSVGPPPDNMLYELPVDLQNSSSDQVAAAMVIANDEDSRARNVIKVAQEAAQKAATPGAAETILEKAEIQRQQHLAIALSSLAKAASYAQGKEQVALELELAQRHKHAGNCEQAVAYFSRVAENTVQPYLKQRALSEIKHCQKQLENSKPRAEADSDG